MLLFSRDYCLHMQLLTCFGVVVYYLVLENGMVSRDGTRCGTGNESSRISDGKKEV